MLDKRLVISDMGSVGIGRDCYRVVETRRFPAATIEVFETGEYSPATREYPAEPIIAARLKVDGHVARRFPVQWAHKINSNNLPNLIRYLRIPTEVA